MAALGWYHERFAQDLARRLCAGEPKREARTAAYIEAFTGKPDFDPAKVLSSNVRRLANQKPVKNRVAELTARAAVLADTDRGWCIDQLRKRIADFNVDNFLTGKPGDKGRRIRIDHATRAQLGQLAELSVEEIVEQREREDGETHEVVRIKSRIKPYDPIATVRLIADLSGAMPAARHEHSGPGGGKIMLGLEALVLASMTPPVEQLPALQKAIDHAA